MDNYLEINKTLWNAKMDYHVASEFYDNQNFLEGASSLNPIELELLGNVEGKSILHLQCHFGQDSISLSRLGAKVTGVDLSDQAIKKAEEMTSLTQTDATFICCDVYSLPQFLTQEFDIVFTSYGTIGWLPDMDKWAKIVHQFLKPQGKLIFVEFHPVVWMYDNDFSKIQYNYFNETPIIEEEQGTYADPDAPISNTCITWNHSISEVLNSLIKNGLTINGLNEFDYSPYNCFNQIVQEEPKKYRIKHLADKFPMVYSILATKK